MVDTSSAPPHPGPPWRNFPREWPAGAARRRLQLSGTASYDGGELLLLMVMLVVVRFSSAFESALNVLGPERPTIPHL